MAMNRIVEHFEYEMH